MAVNIDGQPGGILNYLGDKALSTTVELSVRSVSFPGFASRTDR